MDFQDILKQAVEQGTSDILLVAGTQVAFKKSEHIFRLPDTQRLTPSDMEEIIGQIYELAGKRDMTALLEQGDDDFSFAIPGLSRFRANTFKQRGSLSAVIRVVRFDLPDYHKLGIPDSVMTFSQEKKGLVLFTGPAGSGKSTTLACIINEINEKRDAHIITIEDPIEYLHRHKKSVVTQRELAADTVSYDAALRAALRQAPDVILLGEMRDYEAIRMALTAAETGTLVISTLHTTGAANTIDRIVDVFPPAQQQQIRIQLAGVLKGVVSQQLVPDGSGGVVPAFEVVMVNAAIRTMIREARLHQMESVIQSSAAQGMVTMDASLIKLVKEGKISAEEAARCSENGTKLLEKLNLGR